MEILVYMQIFDNIIYAVLYRFLPSFTAYKTYILALAVITSLAILSEIIKRKGKVPSNFCIYFLIYSFVIFSYYAVTPIFYSVNSVSARTGSLLSLVGQVLPNALFACFVAENDEMQIRVKKLAPVVGVILAITALLGTLFPDTTTSVGLLSNEGGLGYQRLSYMAAYSAALMEYYLLTRDQTVQLNFLTEKLGSIISAIVIFVDLVVTLVSGGRGGFVAYILFFGISILFAIRFGFYDIKKGFSVLIIGSLSVIAANYGFSYVSNIATARKGFGRLLTFINGGGDIRRFDKYLAAWDVFSQKPIWGHGFGSVYYEFGQYTHNFFTDALVEGGLVLVIIILLVLAYCMFASLQIIKNDKTDLIWIYFFLCGFILSLFSGYYLTQIPLWWGLFFILAKIKRLYKEMKEKAALEESMQENDESEERVDDGH